MQKWAARVPHGSASHSMRGASNQSHNFTILPLWTEGHKTVSLSLQPPAMHSFPISAATFPPQSSSPWLAPSLSPTIALLVFENRLWTFGWILISSYVHIISLLLGICFLGKVIFYTLSCMSGWPNSTWTNVPQPVGTVGPLASQVRGNFDDSTPIKLVIQ